MMIKGKNGIGAVSDALEPFVLIRFPPNSVLELKRNITATIHQRHINQAQHYFTQALHQYQTGTQLKNSNMRFLHAIGLLVVTGVNALSRTDANVFAGRGDEIVTDHIVSLLMALYMTCN